jgi:hypothetical protein
VEDAVGRIKSVLRLADLVASVLQSAVLDAIARDTLKKKVALPFDDS